MKYYNKIFLALIAMILLGACSTQEISNEDRIYSLAKTFGYIRYFHPSDEAAGVDWEKFAYYSAKNLSKHQNQDLATTLEKLFLPIAPSMKISENTDELIDLSSFSRDDTSPVYWQHKGYGKGAAVGPIYGSSRTNRQSKVYPNSTNDFGSISQSMNIETLVGKEVKLSADIKLGPFYAGRPYILIDVKRKGGNWISYSSQGQSSFKGKWAQHEVVHKVEKDTEAIRIYFVNVSLNGAVFIDNMSFQAKMDNEFTKIPLSNNEFENREEFESNWNPRGDNQDFEIVSELNDSYLKVSRTKGVLQENVSLISDSPKESEIIHKSIGSGLFLHLPIVLYGDSISTYPKANKEIYRQLISDVNSKFPEANQGEDLFVRLGNVILMWNILQHFYPYFDITDIDWDEQLRTAIRKSYADKTMEDHKTTLKQMTSPLNDSHMSLFPTSGDYYPPLRWEYVEDNMVITDVLDSTLDINRGDVIVEINEVNAGEYWEELLKNVHGATMTRKMYKAIDESLLGVQNSIIDLQYRNADGEIQKLSIQRSLNEAEFTNGLTALHPPKIFKELSKETYYVNLNKLVWSDLQKRIPSLAKAKAIIFDLRGYPRWQTHNVVSHFVKDTVRWVDTYDSEILYPDRENIKYLPRKNEGVIFPKEPYITAKKVFMTDGSAVSYSESFLNIIDYYNLADIVGEQTAGSTGNVVINFLLGGLQFNWTGMKVLDQDGNVFHGQGIVPNHSVKKSINGIRAGKDEYLEYALELINK